MKKIHVAFFFLLIFWFIQGQAIAQPLLIWDASTGEVDGYRIYYGTIQGQHPYNKDLGNVTQYHVLDLPLQEKTTYFFVITAYNAAGESPPSNEVPWTVPDATPPAPPQGLGGSLGEGRSVSLNWLANAEADLNGYRVYYGSSSRVYGIPLQVGRETTYTSTALEQGKTYYFAVTAQDDAGNESGYSNEWSQAIPVSDTVAPSIIISSPTAGGAYDSSNSSISLAGNASDNVGVSLVTWRNSAGGSGTASGTESWSITGISLIEGENVLTVTAQDAAGNQTNASLTVTYMPPDTLSPTIAVTSPTTAGSHETEAPTVSLAGNASDNTGVVQVRWTSSAGYSGIAAGTVNWSIPDIALLDGENILTVIALDQAGNEGRATLKVIKPVKQPEIQSLLIAELNIRLKKMGRNYQSIATLTVTDVGGAPVTLANVAGDWFLNGRFLNSASNATDDSGKADFISKKVKPKSGDTFTFVVTDVSKDGMLFEPADSPRTTVSITVP